MHDIIIIGAGVSGCACARELSRYNADILVLEKEEDVCCGTSKANSAIVHAGYDAANGSLMAQLNVEGSRRMPALAKELDFAYDQCGSLVVCLSEDDRPALQKLYDELATLQGESPLIPIQVDGTGIIGTVTVSGLPQRDDHAMLVEELAAMCAVPLGEVALTRV